MATSTEVGLDTSVLMRLLVGEPEQHEAAAQAAIAAVLRKGYKVVVSDLVIAEAYFALQAAYDVPKKDAIKALHSMFASGDVHPEAGGCAPEVLRECLNAASKPGFVDRLIHAQYQSRKASMLTFEKAAAKLHNTQVLREESAS